MIGFERSDNTSQGVNNRKHNKFKIFGRSFKYIKILNVDYMPK